MRLGIISDFTDFACYIDNALYLLNSALFVRVKYYIVLKMKSTSKNITGRYSSRHPVQFLLDVTFNQLHLAAVSLILQPQPLSRMTTQD